MAEANALGITDRFGLLALHLKEGKVGLDRDSLSDRRRLDLGSGRFIPPGLVREGDRLVVQLDLNRFRLGRFAHVFAFRYYS